MKQSLMNFHELAMNRIKTYRVPHSSSSLRTLTSNHELNNKTNQVHNNSSQFTKQSLINFRKLTMNRIMTYQTHNNSSKFMKLSHELSKQAMS